MLEEKKIREIILYGAGKRGKRFLEYIRYTDIEHVYVVDSDSGKWGKKLEGYEIISPDIFSKKEGIPFHITVSDEVKKKEIRDMLGNRYCCKGMWEIGYFELMRYVYRNHSEVQNRVSERQCINQERRFIFDCYAGLGLGGIEAWTLDVCSNLYTVYGEQIRILSRKGNYNVNDKCKSMIDYLDWDNIEALGLDKEAEAVLSYLLQSLPCAVITSQADMVLTIAGVIKKYCKDQIKIISVIHGGMEETYRRYDVYRDDIDLYVGVSRDIQEDLIARGIEQEQVYSMTCPFPCEEELFREYTEDGTMPIWIGYAGRLEYAQKRMDLLLACIKTLAERKVNFRIELAGEGPARLEMENFVSQNNLGDYVKFLGRLNRKDIPDFWQRQDICINLADYEGRSISIIEAMGNGAVPVVTETSGTKEDITNDVNGYTVPISDYFEVADKIEYLSEHRERISELGQKAHEMIYPKSLMKPHIDFWKELLERR